MINFSNKAIRITYKISAATLLVYDSVLNLLCGYSFSKYKYS